MARPFSLRKSGGRKGTTSGAVLVGLVAGVGILGWIVARADSAHTSPASHPTVRQPSLFTPSVLPQDEKTPSKARTQTVASTDSPAAKRRPLSFYTQEIRGGLFSEPLPPEPKPVAPPKPVILPPPDPEPSIVPAPVDPFVDWSYDGTVKMGDKVMALLENKKTKEGQYVQTGDTFLDARVENVTEQTVSLNAAGKPYTISKTDSITVVPLDKSAEYLSENGGQPGGPPQVPPPATNMPQPGMWGGWQGMGRMGGFQNMNPQQRQMMRNYFRNMRQNRMQMMNMGG
ncbi:MAG TPA: hypothetical protein VFA07_07745 [Chthonomonadaceae bacterium]|nr:hypothetical protein [Chthonomonadaceae bacterium]